MATYKFNCSLCNKAVSAHSKYFKLHLQKYFCTSKEELSLRYVCFSCRKERNEKHPSRCQLRLQIFPKFKEIKRLISIEASKLKKYGPLNIEMRNNFLATVKTLFDNEGILKYSFIIEKELKGILIYVPFMGNIIMNLNLNQKDEETDE